MRSRLAHLKRIHIAADDADAARRPELAVRSAMAHGESDLGAAIEQKRAEHAAQKRQLVTEVVDHRAPDAQAASLQLLRQNSEFKSYVPEGGRTPRVTLLPASDPAYFPIGVKHRYTRKPAQ